MKNRIKNILLFSTFFVAMVLLSSQNTSAEVNDIYIDRFDIFTINSISLDNDDPDKIQVKIDVFNQVFFDPSTPDDAFTVNLADDAKNVRLLSGNGSSAGDVNDICSISGNTVSCGNLQQCFPLFGCIDRDINTIFILYDLTLDVNATQQADTAYTISIPYNTGGTGAGSFSLYELRFTWGVSGLPLSFVSTLGEVAVLNEEFGSANMLSKVYTNNFSLNELLTLSLQTPLIEIVEITDPLKGLIYPQKNDGTVDSNPIVVSLKITPPNGGSMIGNISIVDKTSRTEKILFTGYEDLEINEPNELNIQLPTAGEAWDEEGNAVLNREIVAQFMTDDDKILSSFEANYSIRPKPIILVHGLWSNAETWGSYPNFLTDLHSNWGVYAVGDMDTGGGIFDYAHVSKTIAENAKALQTAINAVQSIEGANQVDIIAHSMGGLISRYYIQNLMNSSNKPTVSRLLMLGTPNGGSDCATLLTIIPLGHHPVLPQLRPDYLTSFNEKITDRKGVEFSILAGNGFQEICSLQTWFSPLPAPFDSDGIVSVESALAIPIADNASRTHSFHTEMTGSQQDFTQFVKPRLTGVISGQKTSETLDTLPDINGESEPELPNASYFETIELIPNETQSIQLPQIGGTHLKILLTNMSNVNARLLNPTNTLVDTIDGNNNINQMFASMSDDNLLTGVYTIELFNFDAESKEISISTWVENDPVELELSVTSSQENNKHISTTFKNNDQPVPNATITVQVFDETGLANTLSLYDDGKHNDGDANDGLYSNSFTPTPSEYNLIQVQAEGGGTTRFTSHMIFNEVDGITNSHIYLPLVLRN